MISIELAARLRDVARWNDCRDQLRTIRQSERVPQCNHAESCDGTTLDFVCNMAKILPIVPTYKKLGGGNGKWECRSRPMASDLGLFESRQADIGPRRAIGPIHREPANRGLEPADADIGAAFKRLELFPIVEDAGADRRERHFLDFGISARDDE